MQLQYIATLALAAVTALAGCGDANSPEQQVREVIERMEVAAEARDVGELMEPLSDDYRDVNGTGAEEAARYARGYFIANQSIHLLTRVEQIEFPTDGEARARILVGMVGRDASAAAHSDNLAVDLASLAADLYEFKIALRHEDGEWQITFAEWRRK